MRWVENNVLRASGNVKTVGQLRGMTSEFAAWTSRRVVLGSDDPFEQVAAVLAAAEVGFELGVVPNSWLTPQWLATIRERFHRIYGGLDAEPLERCDVAGPVDEAAMVVFTSGSTRAPEPVSHVFRRLDTFTRLRDVAPNCWLMTYRPGSYGWVQAIMLALLVPGQDLMFPRSLDPADLRDSLSDGASAVSSTPSFWRYLLSCAQLDRTRVGHVRQITLGGEPVDQELLDRLRAAFPNARLTQIYASTECGPVLVCSDGRARFPVACLDRNSRASAPAVRIDNGTLHVRSPHSVVGANAWMDTRDVAEVVGDRLYIRGRVEPDAIKVGGQRVALDELEGFVNKRPEVAWARAYRVRSAIVDSLIGLDIVRHESCVLSDVDLERELRQACRRSLGEPYEPRILRFVDELALAPSLKRAVV